MNIRTPHYEAPKFITDRDLLVRVAILGFTSVTILLGWFSEASLTYDLIQRGGITSVIVHSIFSVAWGVAFLELISKTIGQSSRYVTPKFFSYIIIATTYLIQAFIATSFLVDSKWLLIGYLVNAAICSWYCWVIALEVEVEMNTRKKKRPIRD